MKKEIKTLAYVLAMGASLTAVTLGSVVGCGDSSGGTGGGGGGGTVSDSEFAQAFSALATLNQSFTDDQATLRLSGQSAIAIDCPNGGNIDVSQSSTDVFQYTYNACDFGNASFDGAVKLSFTAYQPVTISGVEVQIPDEIEADYQDVTINVASCDPVTLDGVVKLGDIADDVCDTTANPSCINDTDGSTIEYSNLTVNGETINCTITSKDTCPEVAGACGFSESEACDGSAFKENLSCE